jgi:hypothetical protein
MNESLNSVTIVRYDEAGVFKFRLIQFHYFLQYIEKWNHLVLPQDLGPLKHATFYSITVT